MKLAFFAVPALGDSEAEAEVNRFLGSHRVVAIDRHLVSAEGSAYWAICVTYLERSLVPDTYACRDGKGTLAAVLAVRRLAGRFRAFAKLDVRSYFASIDHEVLREILRRRVTGARVLALLDRIVASHEASPGRGLPIGSLCSQHLANLYLSGLDRRLVERRMGLVRYMDDVVIFGRDGAEVRSAAEEAIAFARDRLRLVLAVVHEPAATERGVPLCGFRVQEGRLSLSLRRRRRYVAARRRAEAAYTVGVIAGGALQRAATSALAITAHADAAAFRRRDLSRRPAPDV